MQTENLSRRRVLMTGGAVAVAGAVPGTSEVAASQRGPGEHAMQLLEEAADAMPLDAELMLRVARGLGMVVEPCETGVAYGLGNVPWSAAALVLGWAGRIGKGPIREVLDQEAADMRLLNMEREWLAIRAEKQRVADLHGLPFPGTQNYRFSWREDAAQQNEIGKRECDLLTRMSDIPAHTLAGTAVKARIIERGRTPVFYINDSLTGDVLRLAGEV